MKSPPSRPYYITDKPWSSSSLSRSAMAGYHGYQDSTVSSGRGSLFDGRETGDQGDDHFGSRRGLDDSTYGTLEERHTRSGSRDSTDTDHYGESLLCFCQLSIFPTCMFELYLGCWNVSDIPDSVQTYKWER